MKSTRNLLALLTVAGALLAGTAHAQAPAGDAAGAGTVTNVRTTEEVTTTSPDTTEVIGAETTVASGEPLPDTGGQPLLMVLGGIIVAGGSLLLRRKLA